MEIDTAGRPTELGGPLSQKARRLTRGVLATTVGAAMVVGIAAAAPNASARTSPTGPAATDRRTVTLITGDQVTVDARTAAQVSIAPGEGRAAIRFVTYRSGGHLHVVPTDALALLGADRLDGRLFDVTMLLSQGYDDRRADLPLIVTHGQAASAARASVTATGATVQRDLPAVGGFAVRTPKAGAGAFWSGLTTGAPAARGLRADVSKIWLDGLRQPSLAHSVPQIGAPAAWQAGFDGTGVTVAVLDSGIDATHPDLAGKVVAAQNFTDGMEDSRDLVGHGTHVASIVAGSGAASGGLNKGVAPGAKLLDGKVCFQGGCAESWILAGMQWAAADQRAKVVNLSLGGGDTPELDPIEEAVNTLTAQYGTLFVVAAGNGGDAVSSPASADAALAVGAVDRNEQLASFSNLGPRVGDSAVKPDITAPGVEIVAARSKDAMVGAPGDSYVTNSGTSMAAPHVAGAAAILAQLHPEWTAETLKTTLMASAKANPALGVFAQGAGRVDVAAAISQQVTVTGGSISFGRQEWPHDDDVAVRRTITFHNQGGTAVTLDLSVSATGPGATPAPAGMFSLGASTVTVPAGGQAEVSATADTRLGTADGAYSGYVTASSGGVGIAHVPFGVDRGKETYDLTINHIERDGQPAPGYFTLILSNDSDQVFPLYAEPDATNTIRLPKGSYQAYSILGAKGSPESTLLADPLVDLTGNQVLTADARAAKPFSVTVPEAAAKAVIVTFGGGSVARPGSGFAMTGFGFEGLYSGQFGATQPVEGFTSYLVAQLAKAGADGSFANSPYLYNLAFTVKGRMLDGLTKKVAKKDLATIRADFARQAGTDGDATTFGLLPGEQGGVGTPVAFSLPFNRTEYNTTDGGVAWVTLFTEVTSSTDESAAAYFSEGRVDGLRPGRTYEQSWNRGVFGPGFPVQRIPDDWVSRLGDNLYVRTPLYNDGAGRRGESSDAAVTLTLYRDGVKVATADGSYTNFAVPAGEATYRLVAEATRPTPASVRTVADWTFRSGHVAGTTPLRLPLLAVRFSPQLDQFNHAPAGRRVSVPVTVESQPGSAAKAVKQVTVDVSFDDGTTWRSVPVESGSHGSHVTITNPSRGGAVSLRAKAVDKAGNQIVQTIIRAYLIG